jgi:integrase
MRGGILYYHRRIPKDVQRFVGGGSFRKVSLRTRDPREAAKKAATLTAQDDARWKAVRQNPDMTTRETRDAALALLGQVGVEPGSADRELSQDPRFSFTPMDALTDYFDRHFPDYAESRYGDGDGNPYDRWTDEIVGPVGLEAVRLLREDPTQRPMLLSDALETYLTNHNKGSLPKFIKSTRFAVDQAIEAVGDMPLQAYRRDHAKRVRDHMLARGNKTTSVRRRLNTIKAVFNKGLLEFELQAKNPFEKIEIRNEEVDATERQSFTDAELKTITHACHQKDDSIRHIIAMCIDTGARLSEIVGLRIEDVVLDHEVPHIRIRPHEKLGRTLKNANSRRDLPLRGAALWGAKRAAQSGRERGETTGWLFPRYAADDNIKATHASNTIGKWLGTALKIDKTIHSARHAMRDRLRNAGVPKEIQDILGGWGKRTIGQGYGEGYSLVVLRDHLQKVIFWDTPTLAPTRSGP